jgi:hypothetical protein
MLLLQVVLDLSQFLLLLLQVDLDLSQCLWMLGVVGVLVPITWLGTPNDFW